MKNFYFGSMAAIMLLFFQVKLSAQTLPTGITGLKLWLDASDVNFGTANPADGTNVTTWRDKSGLTNNATVYAGQSAGKVYANQINGKSVIRFAATSQFNGTVYETLGVDIRAVAATSSTIFTVYKQGTQTAGVNQAVWGNDNGGWDRFFFSSYPTAYSVNDGGVSVGTPAIRVPNAGIVGALQLLTAVYISGTPSASAIYFNGQLVTNFTDATNTTAAYPDLRIGFDGDDNCFSGDIAEMIVYNRQLNACEIQQVNRYLGAKYGVTFSTASVTGNASFPEGGSSTLTSSTGTAYQWLRNGTAISGATASTYVARTPGNYSVAVTNSCVDTSATVTLTQTTMNTPGNALAFDGVDDYVDCGDLPAFATTNIKTMEAWVKFSNLSADQEIISKSIGSNGMEMLIYNLGTGNPNLCFFCMNGTVVSYVSYPASNFQTGVWYHLAAVWDGTKENMRLYVNGASVGSRTDAGNINTGGVNNPAASLKIGQWSQAGTNRFFTGSIDEVRIWSVPRTQPQIQGSMYDIVSPTTGLEGYYKFDLGSAGTGNSGVNSLYDVSGNYRPGTLNNFLLSGTASNWVESYGMVVPTATAATSIGSTTFTANWTAPGVGTVDNYQLYVARDAAFTQPVTGYNPLTVASTVTSANVTGLSPTTTYYYRTRASKATVANQGSIPTTFSTLSTLATLPVTLVNFTAVQQGSTVMLQWSTSSELNTAHFQVERSSNGTDFSRIASVDAAGTSSALRKYNSGDKTPKNGTNFYRLKQVDLDGNFTYSAVQQVVFVEGKAYTILYPSPAIDHFTLETNDPVIAGSTAIMTDIQGKIVKKFVISGNRQQVSIGSLNKGVYQVQLANKSVFRIVKE